MTLVDADVGCGSFHAGSIIFFTLLSKFVDNTRKLTFRIVKPSNVKALQM